MELNAIKEFLRNKQGYLKEGSRRLRDHLKNKGLDATINNCKTALREVNAEVRHNSSSNRSLKVLFYDIETSPNIGWFWRAGYKQNISHEQIIKERAIICVSYKWEGEDQVYNLTWDKDQSDYFLVQQFAEVLKEADLIVAHNGDNFDIKWLKTRALYHRIPMLPNYKQFDTLKVAKTKLYLNSNKLDYISKLLGFEGKIKTTIDLWLDIIFKNDRDALNEMVEYCNEDVHQLEKVYNELKFIDNPYSHLGVLNGGTKVSSPVSGTYNIEHVKTVVSNRGSIKHIMRDIDTNRIFEMSDSIYKKYKLNQ